MKIHYDLHIHTVLSPCGDNDMTPNNIVNMAVLKGLDVIAICDHNSSGNAGVVMRAAKNLNAPLVVLPGLELTTSEDIHVLCLFKNIEDADNFSGFVMDKLQKVRSSQKSFGCQTYIDEFDHPVGEQDWLLIAGADIGIYQICNIISKYNGFCMPAHIDKQSNGLYAILGAIDTDMGFCAVEIKDDAQKFVSEHPELTGYRIFNNSDAHYLWDMSECNDCNALEVESLDINDIFTAIKGGENG